MNSTSFHPVAATSTYATVILPIAVPKPYTYLVPEELIKAVHFGQRVEVPFGRSATHTDGKHYAALVIAIHNEAPEAYQPKPILSIIDERPIINESQLKLWKWMSSYYSCTLGEIMNAAFPSNMKLSSETRLVLSPLFQDQFEGLTDKEYLIAEALHIQEEISVEDVRSILDQKTIYPLIKQMLEKKIIYLKEDLKAKYTPKKVACLRLQEPYRSQPELLEEAFEVLSRSNRQVETMMAFIQFSKRKEYVTRAEVCKKANVDTSVVKAMVKKGVLEVYEKEISRLGAYEEETIEAHNLSEQQIRAVTQAQSFFDAGKVVLLHGVTGSGKTRVYVELIQDALKKDGQVLYLLPEIALTAQLVHRLQKIFGDDIAVYHSRLNNNERVELWNSVLEGKRIILGARSSMFLPFNNLELVVIDEEHDPSFKQNDPAPRYNGRDSAIYLAHIHGAKVILGTATPSIESYQNALAKKYGLVEMNERFGGLEMPEIILVDAKKELKERKNQSHFTSTLLDELKKAVERGEQAILFQNRRGFSPTYRCNTCGWHSGCIYCDVSLTYHKFHNSLKCHYCGYETKLPQSCPACGKKDLTLQGFGTEKIEDELKIYLPDARIGRMDFDTVRTKNAHANIIHAFEEQQLDILVGTQMVTKGLDFENVGLVGILSADQLLHFPDFRATERAFQLMVQVSGRAGRKHQQGKVLIQAFNIAHPVLGEVTRYDYSSFFAREIQERQAFKYPPYYRLIKVTLKHKKPQVLNDATRIIDKFLKKQLGEWVIGPAMPYVSRVRTYYLMDFLIKVQRDGKKLQFAKKKIIEAIHHLHGAEGFSGVRVSVDVDPN